MVSIADVDQAEAELADLKARTDVTAEERAEVNERVRTVRRAWREQEEAAGRRTGLVGGDVVEE